MDPHIAVGITYFFVNDTLDVDNIPKLILDALNGLVFGDDRQVSDLSCRKRDLNAAPHFTGNRSDLVQYIVNQRPVLEIQVEQIRSLEV